AREFQIVGAIPESYPSVPVSINDRLATGGRETSSRSTIAGSNLLVAVESRIVIDLVVVYSVNETQAMVRAVACEQIFACARVPCDECIQREAGVVRDVYFSDYLENGRVNAADDSRRDSTAYPEKALRV